MIMFFLNNIDRYRFLKYLRENGMPDPKPIGDAHPVSRDDRTTYFYQQMQLDVNTTDLIALKLMFDIKHSVHR